MATGNITGKTNVPSKLIEYTGLSTYTTNTTIDNQFYTFAVDVKRVPNTLTITKNTLYPEWIAYDGSESQHIDLSPIIINDEDFEDYAEDALTKIYRKPTGDNFIEAPYIVNKEAKEPVFAYVDFSVSGISNNSPIPANKFLSSFDDDLSSFIGSVDVVNLYANIYNDGEYSGSYMRLGSKNNLGSITLYLNYTISSIRIGAGKYFTDTGNVDTNARLFVNGQEVDLSDEAEIVEQTITLYNPSSTITIENRRSSGSDKGRVFITSIGNGEGGTTYSEKQLAFKEDVPSLDNYVTTNTTQTIDADKTFDGDVYVNGETVVSNYITIRNNNRTIYTSNDDGLLGIDVIYLLKYRYDEDNDKTYITFPIDIVPEYMAEDSLGYLWFNYENNIVVNEQSNVIFHILQDDGVVISIDGEYSKNDLYFYDLVYSRGSNENRLDYSKLGPNGGGTKLYKHDIKFIHSNEGEEEEDPIHLIVINNSFEPYSYTFNENSTNLDEIVLLDNVLSMYVGNNYERTSINSAIIFHWSYDSSQALYNAFICDYDDILVWDICENEQDDRYYYGSRIVDTVSQL